MFTNDRPAVAVCQEQREICELAATSPGTVRLLGMAGLEALLEDAVQRLGTQQRVADELGISTSRLGRIRKGEHSLDALNLLKLARLLRRSPSVVLRAAGKGELAEAIEQFYGRAATDLTDDERELLHEWHSTPDDLRQALRLIVKRVAIPGALKRRRSA